MEIRNCYCVFFSTIIINSISYEKNSVSNGYGYWPCQP